ncbi:MAG TPA: hypothetical protein PLL00_08630 [Bacteroidia bacterium]|nr:hypothetical protein [Bacteroidia bacterium]
MMTTLNKTILVSAIAIFAGNVELQAQSTTPTNDFTPTNFLGYGDNSGDLFFRVNNTNRLVLKNTTGLFGIGNLTPTSQLHVTSGATSTNVASFQTNAGFNGLTVKSNGKIAIGTPDGSAAQVDIRGEALPNTYENLFMFTVTDAAANGSVKDYVAITNATATDGQFAPLFASAFGSGSSAPNLNFRAQTPFANDIGGTPMSKFDAYLLNTSDLVAVRPLVQFTNRGNIRVSIAPNGSIYSGSIPNGSFSNTPAAQLHIINAGTTPTSLIAKFQNNTSVDVLAIRNDNRIIYTDGNQGAGKVLTSDANGVATWQTAPAGGGSSQWTTAGNDISYTTGNVGVGTATPDAKLHIAGAVKVVDGTQAAGKVLTSDANGLASWQSLPVVAPSQWTTNGSTIYYPNGKVLIGDPNLANFKGTPGTYQLYVQGGILSEKVKVAIATSNDWADYVFAADYKLKTLSEVERFILANKHLPNVPSAEQVAKEGIDMAKMDAKLMEKIEELTLYLIELDKKNAAQEKRITELTNTIKALENK